MNHCDKILLASDEFAELHGEPNIPGTLVIHFHLKGEDRWNKDRVKSWKEVWGEVKRVLKSKGVDEVVTVLLKEDTRVIRFQKHFGFTPYLDCYNFVIYRQVL